MSEPQGNYCVPWFNIEEWLEVKQWLQSNDQANIRRAFDVMSIWKIRCNHVPVYVECTLGILYVLNMYNEVEKQNTSHQENLRLLFSTAVTRFVNHISTMAGNKKGTLYAAAKSQNIPDWMINLRHEIAHGHDLPGLDVLKMAANYAFSWLLENYWAIEETNMFEIYAANSTSKRSVKLDKAHATLIAIVKVWLKINSSTSGDCKLKQLIYLPDDTWTDLVKLQKKLKRHFLPLIGNSEIYNEFVQVMTMIARSRNNEEKFKFGKRKSVSDFLKNLLKMLELIITKYQYNIKQVLVDGLLENNFLQDKSEDWMKWHSLIETIHNVNGVHLLISALVKRLVSENSALARDWLKRLSQALENLKTSKYSKMDAEHYYLPPTKQNSQISLELFRELLLNPSSDTISIIKSFLKLCNPKPPLPTRNLIKQLMRVYLSELDESEEYNIPDNEIYSIDHLQSKKSSDQDENNIPSRNAVWKKSAIDLSEWKNCPIGLLPGQTTLNLNVPSNVKWYEQK